MYEFKCSEEISICFPDHDLILVGDVTLSNSRGKPFYRIHFECKAKNVTQMTQDVAN